MTLDFDLTGLPPEVQRRSRIQADSPPDMEKIRAIIQAKGKLIQRLAEDRIRLRIAQEAVTRVQAATGEPDILAILARAVEALFGAVDANEHDGTGSVRHPDTS